MKEKGLGIGDQGSGAKPKIPKDPYVDGLWECVCHSTSALINDLELLLDSNAPTPGQKKAVRAMRAKLLKFEEYSKIVLKLMEKGGAK